MYHKNKIMFRFRTMQFLERRVKQWKAGAPKNFENGRSLLRSSNLRLVKDRTLQAGLSNKETNFAGAVFWELQKIRIACIPFMN